ncbi:MAG: hypothetical protein CTY33_09535 [Methylotenera sp.]|nr:MAG: hypothetical protein CTY33_09535 [Methylotenera sp.]
MEQQDSKRIALAIVLGFTLLAGTVFYQMEKDRKVSSCLSMMDSLTTQWTAQYIDLYLSGNLRQDAAELIETSEGRYGTNLQECRKTIR